MSLDGLIGFASFVDTWDGATHVPGRWVFTAAEGDRLGALPDQTSPVATEQEVLARL